jgi:hypothetical protein
MKVAYIGRNWSVSGSKKWISDKITPSRGENPRRRSHFCHIRWYPSNYTWAYWTQNKKHKRKEKKKAEQEQNYLKVRKQRSRYKIKLGKQECIIKLIIVIRTWKEGPSGCTILSGVTCGTFECR